MTLMTLCSRAVRSAALAAALAVSLAPTLSHADGIDDGPASIAVSTKDLDLQTAAGAQELLTRVSVAAESACGVGAMFDALETAKFEVCYRKTVADAVRQINRPLVTQAYFARWPREALMSGLSNSTLAAKN
jgi:UrcA family protein